MYFKAMITRATESQEQYKNGVWFADPNGYQDHGVIQTLTSSTLAELKSQIERAYFNLEKPIGALVQTLDGRIEIYYEGEHTQFNEIISIYISKVNEEQVDFTKELLFRKIPQQK